MPSTYSKTVWVASTAPGISATNLNNLETASDAAVAYYDGMGSVAVGAVPSSIGLAGTSTKWAHGDHKHQYGTSTMFANSVTGATLAHVISGTLRGDSIDNFFGADIVKRAGTYHIHMVNFSTGSTAKNLHLYQNGVTAGSVLLDTSTEHHVGDIAFSVGDILQLWVDSPPHDASAGKPNAYFVLFYNSDGWW